MGAVVALDFWRLNKIDEGKKPAQDDKNLHTIGPMDVPSNDIYPYQREGEKRWLGNTPFPRTRKNTQGREGFKKWALGWMQRNLPVDELRSGCGH